MDIQLGMPEWMISKWDAGKIMAYIKRSIMNNMGHSIRILELLAISLENCQIMW
jgi:hypothetical protein